MRLRAIALTTIGLLLAVTVRADEPAPGGIDNPSAPAAQVAPLLEDLGAAFPGFIW